MNRSEKELNKGGLVLYLLIIYLICNTCVRRTTDRAFDFLIGRKHSRKDRQVKVSLRELKAQIYWPTTDQKVRGSNPCGRTNWFSPQISLRCNIFGPYCILLKSNIIYALIIDEYRITRIVNKCVMMFSPCFTVSSKFAKLFTQTRFNIKRKDQSINPYFLSNACSRY